MDAKMVNVNVNMEETAVTPQDDLVTIIVPTRNEAQNIQPLLHRLSASLSAVPIEILFVDDSTDNTPEIIKLAANGQYTFPVRLIARPISQRNGLSGAVVDGFQAAMGTWVCVMDADLQHPPEVIPQLLAHAREIKADIVVGSRRGNWLGPLGLSRRRAATSQTLTVLARMLFPQLLKNVSDPLTGLFLVRRSKVTVNLLRPDGFKILLEILIRCPEMRVSEIHFDFAERHSGHSKADLREGLRFFRHLVRLRLTAARWFPRYLVVRVSGLFIHLVGFLLLLQMSLNIFWAAIAATQLATLWNFYWTDHWVFNDGETVERRQRFSRFWWINQLLLLLRLPILYGLVILLGLPAWVGLVLSVFAVGAVRYGASEQWIWNKGLSWQLPIYHYNIHDLVGISSQVRLPDLAAFATDVSPPQVDIQLRVDRHGTPSRQPGGFFYDEALGRFGFGVSVMLARQSEVVVSPALQRAPYALYKSVLEPVLRWTLAQKQVVLVPAAGVAWDERGVLLVTMLERGKTATAVALQQHTDATFLGDDGVLVGADGRLWSFVRPVSITPYLRQTAVSHLPWPQRLWLFGQTLIYSRGGRRAGLWLSHRRLPAATLNLYLQRLIPPPKVSLARLLPKAQTAVTAQLSALIDLRDGPDAQQALSAKDAAVWLAARCEEMTGFPPYQYVMTALRQHQGVDIHQLESVILSQALQYGAHWQVQRSSYNWWPVVRTLISRMAAGNQEDWQNWPLTKKSQNSEYSQPPAEIDGYQQNELNTMQTGKNPR